MEAWTAAMTRAPYPTAATTGAPAASSPAGCSLATKTTDEEGQVHYECDERGAVELEINGGTTPFERVTFGMPVLDQQDPTIDNVNVDSNTNSIGRPPVDLSQVTVEYLLADQPSGLDHVALSLRDDSDNLVMNTTHVFEDDQTREGIWKTPWFEEADTNGYTVVIEVFDRAGNSAKTEVTL
jgi:hypothetical protein